MIIQGIFRKGIFVTISFFKGKKFLQDIVINIFSTAIIVSLLQFLVYPLISRKFNVDTFGDILTIMGIINIVSVVLGNSLNNIRLIVNNDYLDKKISGDFIPILLLASIVNLLSILLITSVNIVNELILNKILIVFISLLTMLRAYLSVGYRLKIDYNKIFYHSVIYAIGLITGVVIFYFQPSNLWEIVFLFGEIFSIIFLFLTTSLHREPFKLTKKFKSTFNKYSSLAFSNFIGNVLVYLDRLMILPLLGGKQVAVYYAATLIGKMSSFILQPVSGVLLTYFSKSKRRMKVKEFLLINLLILIFGVIAFVGCIYFSTYILKYLYPNLYDDVSEILILATIAAILTASSSITQSIILRYCATFWQTVIQSIYGLIYIVVGVILINHSGLIGFCIATTFAAVVKMLLIILIGSFSLKLTSNYEN